MEWVVGQWAEVVDDTICRLSVGEVFQVEQVTDCGRLKLKGYDMHWTAERFKPFTWQVGKTYKTTLEGVTATVDESHTSSVVCKLSNGIGRLIFCNRTGKPLGCETIASVQHLLPFLADEPSEPEPTLTERYTVEQSGDGWLVRDHQDGRVARFSTRDNAEYGLGMIKDGDQGFCWTPDAPARPPQPDPINPPHYRDHPSGVECIQVAEHMPYCLGNAIKYLWRAGKKGDAVEDLRKAAWYINREIERLTKGGAE